ncbi:MAG: hypothetical protein JW746_06225 [Candidatus Krumholzibacteriota bacterium]|nr:hypothetical protein [Candidatus Krumholzibacteriota bacterium]
MKVAIPIWNQRISPVFDTACRIIVADIREGREVSRNEYDIGGFSPAERVRQLESLGINMLVCGAISNRQAQLVDSMNIAVIPWVSAEIEEVLGALSRGSIGETDFLMPGCRGRGRRRRGSGGDCNAGRGRRRKE